MNRRTSWLGLSLAAGSALVAACSGSATEASSNAPPVASSGPIASSTPAAVSSSPPAASTSAYQRPAGPIANDASLHPALKAIATEHGNFFRADGTWWSPLDCRAPPPAPSRVSDAPRASEHGQKLYTLLIADFEAYARDTGAHASADAIRALKGPSIPGVAQAIVKESYEPTTDKESKTDHFIAPVTKDGKTFYAGAPRDLFIMYRPTSTKLDTDAGWLYGTVSPKGDVTSAGKVASCMRCHADAPHGRLFGPRLAD